MTQTSGADAKPAEGRRARKRQESRERLYAAAIALFLDDGFDATTVEQIANRADVARTTAFNYFPQKTAYLEEWGSRRRHRVRTRLELDAPGEGSAAAHLCRYLQEMALVNTEARLETQALMEPSIRMGQALFAPTLDVDLAAVVHRGQQSGEFRDDVAADQVGVVLAATYFSTVLHWTAAGPSPFDLEDRLQQTLDLLLRGLG